MATHADALGHQYTGTGASISMQGLLQLWRHSGPRGHSMLGSEWRNAPPKVVELPCICSQDRPLSSSSTEKQVSWAAMATRSETQPFEIWPDPWPFTAWCVQMYFGKCELVLGCTQVHCGRCEMTQWYNHIHCGMCGMTLWCTLVHCGRCRVTLRSSRGTWEVWTDTGMHLNTMWRYGLILE